MRACETPRLPRLSPTGLNPTPASSGVGQAGSSSSPSYRPRSDQDSTGDPRFHCLMPVLESPMVETAGNLQSETPTEKKGCRNNPAIHLPAPAFFVYYAKYWRSVSRRGRRLDYSYNVSARGNSDFLCHAWYARR